MNKKVLTKGEIKKFMFIDKIYSLDIRKSPTVSYDIEDYLVTINGMQESFQWDGEKLYLDEVNSEECQKEMETHANVAQVMEDEGKSQEEIREYLKGKGTEYLDRVEYIIKCEGLIDKIKEGVTLITK